MNEALGDWPGENDFEGCTFLLGPKEKFHAAGAVVIHRLLPLSLNKDVNVPKKYPRVKAIWMAIGGNGLMPALPGYGKMEVDSPFEGYAGPLDRNRVAGEFVAAQF